MKFFKATQIPFFVSAESTRWEAPLVPVLKSSAHYNFQFIIFPSPKGCPSAVAGRAAVSGLTMEETHCFAVGPPRTGGADGPLCGVRWGCAIDQT